MRKLRYFLKAMTIGITTRVRAGPLAGLHWSLFTGVRFIRGNYGGKGFPSFLALLESGAVVYDVGAHVGYFALCAAKAVGKHGRVIAFEPLPLNLKYLRLHISANRIDNVDVIAAGVSDTDGKACFDISLGTGRGHLSASGDTIDVVSLDELCESGRIRPPHVIKMDIEGAETRALRGARRTLARYLPTISLSLHGAEARRECLAFLQSLGYRIEWVGRSNIVARAAEPVPTNPA